MSYAIKRMQRSEISPAVRIGAYAFLMLFVFITVIPLLWMLYSSFKLQGEIMMRPLGLPLEPTFKNYIDAWTYGNMGIAAYNSLFYTALATAATVLLSAGIGFGLTKFKIRVAPFIYSLFVLGLLITVNSVITPLFIMETRLGLYNTRAGVILPYIAFGLPMAVLLSCSYIRSVPDSLIEAAIIDGAGYLQVFWKIILGVSIPVLATIAILTFLRNWNEFILVFILTSGADMRSLPVSINSFAGRLNVNYGMQLAALVVGTIPMIVFYLFAHEQLAAGFGEGALKE